MQQICRDKAGYTDDGGRKMKVNMLAASGMNFPIRTGGRAGGGRAGGGGQIFEK